MSDTVAGKVVAMHEDCVVCLSQSDRLSSKEAVMVLLMMLRRGIDPEQVHRDLCFVHRREVENEVRQWEEAEPDLE